MKIVNALSPLPVDGAEFDLELWPVDPIEMVRGVCNNPDAWRYEGVPISNIGTKRFKLICLAPVSTLAEAQNRAKSQGFPLAIGQCREPFRKVFQCDLWSTDTIAFGGNESVWISPQGEPCFPVLLSCDGRWLPYFYGAGSNKTISRSKNWRWLVEVV